MIRFEHVRVAFQDKVLFRDFNLTVKPGEKILLFGPSGTGKTTLLRLILGFTLPDEGSVRFNDIETSGSSVWQVRKHLAYIPQNPDIGEGPVEEVIGGVLSLKTNSSTGKEENRLYDYLESFQLDKEILKKDFTALSGGEKQRIALITGFLMDRKVFLLDEVTSALDAGLKKQVVDLFADREEWTVLVVSHDTAWQTRREFTTVPIGGRG